MSKHDELVEAGFFDSKFKNTLRDYYIWIINPFRLTTERAKWKTDTIYLHN